MFATEITPESIRDIIISAAVLIGACTAIFMPFLRALDRRIANIVMPMLHKLEDIEADVADVRHEVNNNSGNSLKYLAGQALAQAAINGAATATLAARFEDHIDFHQKGTPA